MESITIDFRDENLTTLPIKEHSNGKYTTDFNLAWYDHHEDKYEDHYQVTAWKTELENSLWFIIVLVIRNGEELSPDIYDAQTDITTIEGAIEASIEELKGVSYEFV